MSKSEDTNMKVLKTATCPMLSGKSKLTYQIGINPDSIVHLRISKNDGGGFFSDEWLSIDSIIDTLKKRHKESGDQKSRREIGCSEKDLENCLREFLSLGLQQRCIHSSRNLRLSPSLTKALPQYRPYTDLGVTLPLQRLTQFGENMSFINVAILTALCLLLPVTRIYGVIGLGILLYFRPLLSLIVLATAGIAYYFYRRTTA